MKNVRVGDKLVLRKDLEVGKEYGGIRLLFSMKELNGFPIVEMDNTVLVGDYMSFYYSFEMLDLDYYKELREKETVKDYKISMGGKLSTKSYTEKEAEMIYSLLKHDLKIDDVKFVYLGEKELVIKWVDYTLEFGINVMVNI